MRMTIENVGGYNAPREKLDAVVDRGCRRHRLWPGDFDSRPYILKMDLEMSASNETQNVTHLENKIVKGILSEFGERDHLRKIKDFIDLGPKHMSVLSHHNLLFEQARQAFVFGSYYPALVGACALGERILNHLIIDLRENFQSSHHYGKIYRKKSFQDWGLVILILKDWGVLLPQVESLFTRLEELRNQSVHFNPETSSNLRSDALEALNCLGNIISEQFSAFGNQPWFIGGTPGVSFIKSTYETNPFVRFYLLPNTTFVGYLHGFTSDGASRLIDYADYGDGVLSDEAFRDAYNNRDPRKIARINSNQD